MPSTAGAVVRTWGSSDDTEESGMRHQAACIYTGTNVGHAAVELTLPDTPDNLALVKRYLDGTGIPYEQKKLATKGIEFEPVIDAVTGRESYSSKTTDKNAYEEDVIQVYFSWWPDENSEKGYQFNTLEEDMRDERFGVHVTYANPEYFNPEQRVTQGFTKQIITLPPLQIMTTAGATELESRTLMSYHQVFRQTEDINAIALLLNKLGKRKDETLSPDKLSTTEKI